MSGPLDLEIVAMRGRHVPGVLRIERQVYPTPWSMSLFLQELRSDHRVYRVARRAGRSEVLGYAGVIILAGEGHVATVAVDPSWQRRAIGARLLLEATRGAIDDGAQAMTLEVRVSNTGAQALYRSFGYQPVGVRKNYYSDNGGEDAIVMWAHEITGSAYAERLARIEAGLPGTTHGSAA